MNLIILASGGLGLKSLREIPPRDVRHVFTDKGSLEIAEHARLHGIPCHVGNPRKVSDWSFLQAIPDAWMFSINYLFIVDESMLLAVGGRALNIHGSLLPKYRGRTPHVWAIINGENQAGVSIHKMSGGVDEGDILLQNAVDIVRTDTGGTLLGKYEALYSRMIREALGKLSDGTARFLPQDHSRATYFPKRSEADGRIDWSWQRSRIINWVRAQTRPYPGAFAIVRDSGEKVRIWECEDDDMGFDHQIPDGTVLATRDASFFVKAANGVLRVGSFDGPISPGSRLE